MEKEKLREIFSTPGLDSSDLYSLINYIDMTPNKFNRDDYYTLEIYSMYFYHQKFGIENLKNINEKWPVPYIIDRNISFTDFHDQLCGYKKYPSPIIDDDLLPGIKTCFDNILRVASNELLDSGDWSWCRIFSKHILGSGHDEVGKLYLSIDNKDLYWFAVELLNKFINNNVLDFCFKTNNNSHVTRRDNLVVYVTNENFLKTLEILNETIKDSPNITFNEPSLVGHSISPYISIARDYKKDDQLSYTNCIIDMFLDYLNEGKSFDEAYDLVDKKSKAICFNLLWRASTSNVLEKDATSSRK